MGGLFDGENSDLDCVQDDIEMLVRVKTENANLTEPNSPRRANIFVFKIVTLSLYADDSTYSPR